MDGDTRIDWASPEGRVSAVTGTEVGNELQRVSEMCACRSTGPMSGGNEWWLGVAALFAWISRMADLRIRIRIRHSLRHCPSDCNERASVDLLAPLPPILSRRNDVHTALKV